MIDLQIRKFGGDHINILQFWARTQLNFISTSYANIIVNVKDFHLHIFIISDSGSKTYPVD